MTTQNPKSWKVEVIADNSGKWSSNTLRFANKQDAQNWADDLEIRWILVQKTRITPTNEEPNK